ncbi:LytR/AlgR family response regulator transcription factor [Chitinophaga nivalis]|uniref:Response regulator n=1 Tax=Chitinophaga nivalis TaxID=2991709 RepID=A0ABT3IVZ8_9BACT|nr:response regulator [Chitinophaga nivalis]MCW3462165.1 response regulator [Chitinophaga nivalis]MCW3488143.1 response regulator [Chitinophaga nivalis]
MIKAVIIDDERNSRDIIVLMLEKYCPQITIADTATNCADGVAKIKAHQPQLVFLDLEMPDGTGFDVLMGTQPHIPYEAVFVTAFEKKFQHVIRFSDVELILKPIDKESLLHAVSLATTRITENSSKQRYRVLMDNFNSNQEMQWQLLIPSTNAEAYTINLQEVAYLETQADSCIFHLNNGTVIFAAKPFRYYADLFSLLRFYQINNMQMVQLMNIDQIDHQRGKVLMKSGVALDITARRLRDLQNRITLK